MPLAATPTASALAQPTSTLFPPTPEPSPTAVETLPPLPDFSTHLWFDFGGGGEGFTCGHVEPYPEILGYVEISSYSFRSSYICISKVPLGQTFHVTLTSPDGKIQLDGEFQLTNSPESPQVIWVGHEHEYAYSYIVLENDSVADFVRLHPRWAGNLPTGDWDAQVSWDEVAATGTFTVPTDRLPEIFVLDSRSNTELLPSAELNRQCYIAEDVTEVRVGGMHFLPDQLIYLLVYRDVPEAVQGQMKQKVNQQLVKADETGQFEVALPGPFLPDIVYWMIAGSRPDFVQSDIEESLAPITDFENATDCLIVP
jgi:hypothetical protein